MLSEEASADEFEHSSSHGDAEMNETPGFNLRHRQRARKLYFENIRKQRTAIQNMTKPLKLWLYRNRAHPYPTKSDKSILAKQANMTMTQVNNWFANARRRLKNTVKYPDMAWDQRIRLYNSHVTGNAELLSMTSQEELCKDELSITRPNEVLDQQKVESTEQTAYPELRRSPSPMLHEEPEGLLTSGPVKYKNAIIQRYLNDTLKYGKLSCHYPEPTEPSSLMYSRYIKHRQMSGSSMEDTTCSEDCMSPDPISPHDRYHLTNNNLSHGKPGSWAEELSQLQALVSGCDAPNPRISLSYSDLNAKELSAVMALTDLALGKS